MNNETTTTTTADLDREVTRLRADLSYTQAQLADTLNKVHRSRTLLLDIIGPELTKIIDARLDERLSDARQADADEEGEKIRQEVREMIADGDIHVNIDLS